MADFKLTLELLKQKRDLVTGILATTRSTGFFGLEEDVETYINLIEARQVAINSIIEIEKTLNKDPHILVLSNSSPQVLAQINEIYKTIKEDSQKIIDIDSRNNDQITKSYSKLKSQVKDVNISKNLKSAYHQNLPEVYSKIDATQ